MQVITDEKKIDEVLNRSVVMAYPTKELLKAALLSGKKLRIYNGIDPTGDLHIGHGVVLRKLRQFQDLGHEIIVLIGDFTARIGDPTDKTATRKKLSKEEVEKNALGYKKLISNILDIKSPDFKFLYNEKWTNKLKPEDLLDLTSNFTVSQLLERDMFQNRIKEGKEIYLHEFLYPVFQAYDSVVMDVDMEIGGNDQTFNMLAGRTLMRKLKNKEKFVLTTKLLTDSTGKKMGKTEGNMVNLNETPENMYGKVMSWSDELISSGFEICTDLSMSEVNNIKESLTSGKANPRDLKMKLAFEIVKIFYGEKKAQGAEENFVKTFQKKEVPEEMEEIKCEAGEMLSEVLVKNKILPSKSEWRRLVLGNGVHDLNKDNTITDQNIKVSENLTLKIGKKRFIKVIVEKK